VSIYGERTKEERTNGRRRGQAPCTGDRAHSDTPTRSLHLDEHLIGISGVGLGFGLG